MNTADLHNPTFSSLPEFDTVSSIIISIVKDEILSRFNHLEKHEISEKYMGEIVTEADIQAEIRLSSSLLSLIPNSTVIGEEEYGQNNSVMDRFDEKKPVWIIDPLDGTRNFSQGKTCFCTIVAFCLGKETHMAWIYDPINKKMYSATKGAGAWCNSKIIKNKPKSDLADMVGSVGKRRRDSLSTYHSEKHSIMPRQLIRYRCLGLEYADLATGKLHFAEYNILKPWDHAAGVLIMEEAGGYGAFVDTNEPYRPGPIVNNRYLATFRSEIWSDIYNYLNVNDSTHIN